MFAQKEELVFSILVISFVFFALVGFVIVLIVIHYRFQLKKNHEILKVIYDTEEAERSRFTQELHDDIGAKLSTLKLQNEMLLNETDLIQVNKFAEKNAKFINQIVTDLRTISRNQGSDFIKRNGLKNELELLIFQIVNASNINIHLDVHGPFNLGSNFEIHLFRIIQELLNNSLRHANCSEINVKIISDENSLMIIFMDNGIGFNWNQNSITGMGLQNIKSRTELFKGTFDKIPSDIGIHFQITFNSQNLFQKNN